MYFLFCILDCFTPKRHNDTVLLLSINLILIKCSNLINLRSSFCYQSEPSSWFLLSLVQQWTASSRPSPLLLLPRAHSGPSWLAETGSVRTRTHSWSAQVGVASETTALSYWSFVDQHGSQQIWSGFENRFKWRKIG